MRPLPEESFYVGYRPRAGRGGARFMHGVIVGASLLGLALAVSLAGAQRPFGPGTFEYGTVRELEGTLATAPHPRLRVDRPGHPAEGAAAASWWSLVATGKHGADRAVAGLDGERIRLRGTLIYRGGETMLELSGGPSAAGGPSAPPAPGVVDLGTRTLRGEIVDAKCWLGVMKPGAGKPHRACAALCIRGGIPPMLVVDTENGGSRAVLLADADGRAVGDRLLHLVAEPVAIRGRLVREDDTWILRADPESARRIAGGVR